MLYLEVRTYVSARVLSLLCSLSLCPCSSLVDRSNSLCISSWVIVWLLCKTGRPSLMKKSSRAQPCMHVAIMGEAQCMMIEASMLSANDHETSCGRIHHNVCIRLLCHILHSLWLSQIFPYQQTDHEHYVSLVPHCRQQRAFALL